MNTPNDGGPAFPCGYHPEGNSADQGGMSLRDWFAGQALVGLLSNANGNRELLEPEWAALAYQAADAMIKARSN